VLLLAREQRTLSKGLLVAARDEGKSLEEGHSAVSIIRGNQFIGSTVKERQNVIFDSL